MVDERVAVSLVVEGAREFQRDFLAAQAAVDQLTQRLLSVERIRTPQLSGDIRSAAEAIIRLSDSGSNVDQLAGSFTKLITQLEQSRIRTAQLKESLQGLQTGLGGVGNQSLEDMLGRIGQRNARQQTIAGGQARGELQGLLQQNVASGRSLADVSAASRQAQELAAASGAANSRLQQLLTTVKAAANEILNLGRSSQAAATGLDAQANATDNASRRSITYLSVLSAIHAASFLATNQTFSLIGSFVTLGAAFGKMGVAAGAAGLALGGLLGLFGVISNAIQQIQGIAIAGAQGLLVLGGAAATAATAAGVASVKLAANVESQLAQVRAFGGATAEQLRTVADQAGTFARQYGVAASDVVAATSLFARAGGSVADAINGATEAIIKLQVASAGELSAAQAALLVSAALKQFNLAGDQAVRVADNITAAFQGSALSAIGVQQAFIQAVPGAAALGLSIEDVSAAVALLGDQLIKGTTTGTAFKQFIIDLINPSQKAQQVFQQYGIAIQDASGEALPFIDIVGNLNKALGDQAVEQGKVTNLQREQALAIIFGSRAFLAANILTREGAEGLERYRAALAATTTTDIVSVLLLPLNKQLEIAQTNLQEVGRAFGGPLLQPIREATVAAIGFFQGLLGPAELLGQAISSIATGQGFGQLQQNIAALVGNNALSAFFIEVANSGRNVRDVIVNQIVPAIQDFIQTIGRAAGSTFGLDTIGTTFDGINTAIQNVGATIAGTIRAFGDLVAQMIANVGAGNTLRGTIENLASSILTHLVASLTTTLTAISAAITIMPTLARVALLTAEAALKLAGAFKEVALKFQDVVEAGAKASLGLQIADAIQAGAPREEIDKLRAALNGVGLESENTRRSIAANADATAGLAQTIQSNLGTIDRLEASLKNLGKAPAAALATARKSIEQIVGEIISAEVPLDQQEFLTQDQLNEFTQRAGAMKEAARQELGGVITVVDDLAGQIPDAIANVIAQIQQAQREAQARAGAGGAGVVPVKVDTKAIEAAQKRIAEATSDVTRRLDNLAQDAATRTKEIAASAIERIGDILEKTFTRVTDISDNAIERVNDLFRQVNERRTDRDTLDAFKQTQEDRFTIFQRGLDKEDQALQRALDHRRTERQRDNEDIARDKDQEIQDDERVFSRLQEAAQRAFDRVAQAREVAFDRAQNVEATIFQRGLDREATARQNAIDLAGAKTPEDRTRILQQQGQARQDTAFRQGQEDRLTKFRQDQEDKKRKFSQDAETQAINFRQGLEDRALDHRRQNELILIDFRRKAENIERDIREGEEDAALKRRLDREDVITERRRADQKTLQQEQDRIENVRNEEQAQRIRDQAAKDIGKALREAERQINEVIDGAILALNKQSDDTEKQIRNILDTLVDLKDNFPPDVLAAVGDQLAASLLGANAKADDLKATLEAIRGQKLGEIQVEGATAAANLQLGAAQQLSRLNAPETTVPIGVLAVQTIQATSFVLPSALTGTWSAAVLDALRQADAENLNLSGPEQQPLDLTPIDNLGTQLNRWLGR